MEADSSPVLLPAPPVSFPSGSLLARSEFFGLASMPAELEWFANIDNPRTRRAYQSDLADFTAFVGIARPEEFRVVTRSHVIAWRKTLEARHLASNSIRRKMAALSSLFEYLCERNAVDFNPVKGAKRPRVESQEGKTPALGDHQARTLLDSPDTSTLKGKRDRAILSVFLFHGLRREELCRLRVGDIEVRRGVAHLRVQGKGGKLRYVPLHPATAGLIDAYLMEAGHSQAAGDTPLFQPLRDGRRGRGQLSGAGNQGTAIAPPLTPDGVYKILKACAAQTGVSGPGIGPHSLRATAATNALDHNADIAKVQEWLGHANISTTRIYDRRRSRPEDSPTFKVAY